MFLEKSKSRIEAEFAKRAAEVPAVKEAEKEIETYRPEVALALKFLYTTMPLSDVGNYGVSSFLDYAEHGGDGPLSGSRLSGNGPDDPPA